MKELGEGSRDMTVTMTGWDINPRVLGIVPKDYKVAPFKGMTWVNDAHYMVIPKGVPPEKLAVVLDLMAYLLTPEAQAYTYDKGYFYPGPAVKNVPLSMAPKESQDAIKEFGRPEYEGWLARVPAHAVARRQGAGRSVPDLGPAGRRAEDEVARTRSCSAAPSALASRRRPDARLDRRSHEARLQRTAARRASRAASPAPSGTAFDGAARADADHPARRVHRAARAVGLRQVDGAQLHRRACCRCPAGRSGSTRRASTRCRRRSAASAWCSRTTRCSRT